MAANSTVGGEVTVIEARLSDLESLTTILPRAFHPVNPYIKQTLPDTPSVREWWSRLFLNEIEDPSCNVLIALDPATGKDIGILNLRLLGPEERGVGLWTDTNFEWSPDINREMCQAMIDSMIEYREKLMMGRPNFLIELFGVEQGWKGKAVGTKLLKRACEIADEKGHDVFVQANGSAKGFYERQGFRCEAEVVMPGEAKYMEYMLLGRPDEVDPAVYVEVDGDTSVEFARNMLVEAVENMLVEGDRNVLVEDACDISVADPSDLLVLDARNLSVEDAGDL